MFTWLQISGIFWETLNHNDAPIISRTTGKESDDDDAALASMEALASSGI